MFKKTVKYTNFNDEEVTDVLYFHISKPELIELESTVDGGLSNMIKRIIESSDNRSIIAEFKKLILLAYGEKSDDGKSFRKSDAMREAFSQTIAYEHIFMELAMDDKAASDFLIGALPKDFADSIKENMTQQDKPKGPPPVPGS